MSRIVTSTSRVLVDWLILSAALWLAFLLRFDFDVPLQMIKRLLFAWPYIVLFEYGVLSAFGVPRFAWSLLGLREAVRILIAAAISTAVLLTVRITAGLLIDVTPYFQYALIPTGIILINFGLSFLGVSGARIARRIQAERRQRSEHRRQRRRVEMVPTMLVGAGQAGLMVAKEVATRPDLALEPVGFVDDDRGKRGTVVHGVPVLGATNELAELCRRHGARQVLITIANAPGSEIRRIKSLCDQAHIPAKIIPGIYEIVDGRVNLSRIRNVSIEDLLGREPVELETEAIQRSVAGGVVAVTGAGGSIGSELCRQLCRFEPHRLILVERTENNLFAIHRELCHAHPTLASRIVPSVADVRDADRMDRIMAEWKPKSVFHAAAHKHVPMMEWNPGEAIKNNILGTQTVAEACQRHGVESFVMISTDKAVNPSSVMGASKRAAEICLEQLSKNGSTRFVTVRFGNVLGSAGSVVPIFKQQIANGGPVTVTDPEMTRYFMTIPEACQLVLQAGSMGKGGEIFILDMGQPMKIVDLARDLIRLSGLRPGEDVEIVFTGVRDGEKLFEELSVDEENASKTRHPKIFVGHNRPDEPARVTRLLADLETMVDTATAVAIRAKLAELVPEYRPGGPEKARPRLPAHEQASARTRLPTPLRVVPAAGKA